MSNSKVINSWDWDIRVRERNLLNGTLTEKDLEKARGELPDLADQADPVTLAQPALSGSGEDLSDASLPDQADADADDDDDDDDSDDSVSAAPANGSPAAGSDSDSSGVSEGS